jgi:hypothetical protein
VVSLASIVRLGGYGSCGRSSGDVGRDERGVKRKEGAALAPVYASHGLGRSINDPPDLDTRASRPRRLRRSQLDGRIAFRA